MGWIQEKLGTRLSQLNVTIMIQRVSKVLKPHFFNQNTFCLLQCTISNHEISTCSPLGLANQPASIMGELAEGGSVAGAVKVSDR